LSPITPDQNPISMAAEHRPRDMSPKENKVVAKALFSVDGMTCSPSAGAIEKAVGRLPGIHKAVVDFLNNRAQVLYYPSFVDVS
jgi:Cu+-exporting ATPase